MPDQDLEKLLGGFAADQLTPEEKQRLYSAALQDQQLFNALADEQALKELLADPTVRNRVLQVLHQTGTSHTATWVDWFRRPSGLAWAGGLAAALFAVILGTKIYQDSLKQAAQSVATEETRPAAPTIQAPPAPRPESSSVPERPPEEKTPEAPAKGAVRNDALPDNIMKRERAAMPTPQERRASDAVRDSDKEHLEQDEASPKPNARADELGEVSKSTSPSADQKLAAAPPASAPAPAHMEAKSEAGTSRTTLPAVSARALFYGDGAAVTSPGIIEKAQEQSMRSTTESAPQAAELKRQVEPISQFGRGKGGIASAKPLGLRYSFTIPGADGQDSEVSTTAASEYEGAARLTLESNQEVYLQLWTTRGSRPPQLLFPEKNSGRTQLKLFAGQRQSTFLPTTDEPITITVRLSRIPLGPDFDMDTSVMTPRTLDLLQESVTAEAGASQQEEAIYVVNHEASVDQLTVTFPFPSP